MDRNLKAILDIKLERTAKALNRHRLDTHIIRSREELFEKLLTFLPAGTTCSLGGSQTLFQLGIVDWLKEQDVVHHDRYAPDADVDAVMHAALNCDVYLTSTNAITEDGLLYNMDGRGNRVAALVYGPKKVVVIAGVNKLVADIDAARLRSREIAAPANSTRLELGTPCTHTGTCGDCNSERRICNFELIIHGQTTPHRITVLLLDEQLGY